MIDVNITIPAGDVTAIQATFQKYVAWFHKGPKEAVKKTCVYIVRSLRASTKIGAKTRRIVKNPDYIKVASRKAQNKRIRQLAHIKAWYETRGKAAPSDTAEYFRKYAIERYTQRRGIRYTPISTFGKMSEAREFAKSNMMKQLTIAKRGLAKSSWGWMLGKLGTKSMVDQSEINGTVDVRPGNPSSGAFEYTYIDLANKLGYIRKATKSNVGSILARANRAMIDEMEGHVKKAREQSGLRAA